MSDYTQLFVIAGYDGEMMICEGADLSILDSDQLETELLRLEEKASFDVASIQAVKLDEQFEL